MPQVYCLEWLDDDPDLGMREDGFSLHLTEADANAFVRQHESASCVADPQGAYCVEVPDDLYEDVRASRNGIRRTLPREPAFPRAQAEAGNGGTGDGSLWREHSDPARTLPRVVGGRYRLMSLVQRLGWGEAFAAQDIRTGTPYVVKIGAMSGLAPAFECAHRWVVAVDHRVFVRSLEFGLLDDRRPYAVEELIQGSTLLDLCRTQPLTASQVLDVIGAIAEGLSVAHGRGFFWFDIEPAKTILQERDGQRLFHEPRLTDPLVSDGHILARSPAEAREGVMVGGVYQGLSPEEIRGQDKNPATDVYRLGSMGYFALVGRFPFVAENVMASLFRIVHEKAVFPADSAVPMPVQQLILHCLRTEPEARPPDGQAALKAIREVRQRLG